MLNKKSVEDIEVKGKRVLVRCDFNVPLDENGNITDDTRIVGAMPTIKYLVDNGAKVILCSHIGKTKDKQTLAPVAIRLAELLNKMGEYSELTLRRLLRNSLMLSSDVSCAYDPNYPAVNEMKNTAFFGKGLCFNKYTGSRGKSGCNDANAEFIAKIRKVMDDNKVSYQTSELGKVDQGGGGTIAKYCADLDMEVIDAGIAVQNMHSCYETASKVDIYEAYLGYKAFLKDIK